MKNNGKRLVNIETKIIFHTYTIENLNTDTSLIDINRCATVIKNLKIRRRLP